MRPHESQQNHSLHDTVQCQIQNSAQCRGPCEFAGDRAVDRIQNTAQRKRENAKCETIACK